MNNYYQSFIDKFEKVRSKEELTRTFEMCCGGLRDKNGNEIVRGCNRQAECRPEKCHVYKEYVKWLNIIDEIRKPTVIYVNTDPPKHDNFIHSREYKIKPKTQCKRTVIAQITRYQKNFNGENKDLIHIQELVEKDNFKRARQYAIKTKFDKIANTLGKFINGKLGTVNSENK